MIADMAELSGEPRLKRIVDGFLKSSGQSPSIWHHMVDGTLPVRPLARGNLDQLVGYQRWIANGIAPRGAAHRVGAIKHVLAGQVRLGARALISSSPCSSTASGSRTKRSRPWSIDLCTGIAFEANWDVRVTDLYLQRVAFLLAAGRPDLVKRRWVERVIAKQEQDGGWIGSWYGWGPRLFEFRLRKPPPQSHTTVQGMWILYMLKYRYSGWMDQRYR